MTFDEAMSNAAKIADEAVRATIDNLASGLTTDEDDLSGVLKGNLDSAFRYNQIGGLTWQSSIMRHRKGTAAQEAKTGADMMIHINLNTPTQKYSKGVLIQSKAVKVGAKMSPRKHTDLVGQCEKMLTITPAAFVFNYTASEMRTASATKIAGSQSTELHRECNHTSYRFFLELFKCMIGDPRLTSAKFDDLSIPHGIELTASGTLSY